MFVIKSIRLFRESLRETQTQRDSDAERDFCHPIPIPLSKLTKISHFCLYKGCVLSMRPLQIDITV